MESAKFFVKRFAIYSIWAGEIMKMSLVIFAGLSGFAWFFIFAPLLFFCDSPCFFVRLHYIIKCLDRKAQNLLYNWKIRQGKTMAMNIIQKILGSANDRLVKSYDKTVSLINDLEPFLNNFALT